MSVCGRDPSQLDGRGGSEPPISEAGNRYIYYRLYTKDHALKSINPIYSNDRFIGRTLIKSIAPPRNVASLKRHLWKIEGFDGTPACSLYLSFSEKAPAEDSTRLPLRGGLGSSSPELGPMALVVDTPQVEKRALAETKAHANILPEWPHEQRYVHYRLYDEGGELASKTSFVMTDTSLGRINVLSVPLPHNGTSLKDRISQAEKVLADNVKLFEDDSGEDTLNDNDVIDFLSDTYPGVVEDDPVAIVYEPHGFPKRLRANQDSTMGNHDPTWHTAKRGEIFQTDGVLTSARYYSDGWGPYECYVAINSSGKRAFISRHFATLC